MTTHQKQRTEQSSEQLSERSPERSLEALLVLAVRSGRILRVSLRDGAVETYFDDAGPTPDGIVIEGGSLYWTTMGTPRIVGPGEAGRDYSRPDGGLHMLTSANRHDILPAGSLTTGKQLTSDHAGTLYWADREGCRVSRCRVDGHDMADLVVNTDLGDGTAECVGVAVDTERGHLYWTQKGPAKGGKGRILRAGLDIPMGETAHNRSDIEVLWNGLPEPIDLHIQAGELYWTDRGAPPNGNSLNRAPLPELGTTGRPPEIVARGFNEAIGLVVDAHANRAYVSDLGATIWTVPLPAATGHAGARPLTTLAEPITGMVGIQRVSGATGLG